jgi:hypothetical protein
VKAVEYDINGQWKIIGEEKLSRKAQRERELLKAAKFGNGKSLIEANQSDSDDEQIEISKFKKKINLFDFLFFL